MHGATVGSSSAGNIKFDFRKAAALDPLRNCSPDSGSASIGDILQPH